ncbi:TolC family protein [Dyella ginsengisoli]|uniref:TolC family protein n=1 Tax=Dyella ginsengisoli TaxID=363848 RepID=A0ABW8JPQ0_9GAMM
MHRCPIARSGRGPITAVRVCRGLSALAFTLLAGCATYRPLPLPAGHGAASVGQLSAPLPARAWLPGHRFDPADGLDVTELATLAVANNPDLRSKRDALGVARAQAFAAGLLPDPQLDLGADFPRSNAADLTTGYSAGISADLGALLTRSSRVAAARSQAQQVNLDLLWAEWQTVAQARLLFEQVTTLQARQVRLQRERDAVAPLVRQVQAALRAGNLTHDAASAGLNALADVRQRLADNAVALHQVEADLHALLGLAPDASITLVGPPWQAEPAPAAVRQALDDLPRRRPDLLALQAGYASKEAELRGAIRAQFPAITLGFNTARDTSAVYTNGVTLGITLPLFDRNRGNIAVATATRQQLRDDYAARVLATRTDIQRLTADLGTLTAATDAQRRHAGELAQARRAAESGWQQGELDWPTYLTIRASALSADLDRLDLTRQQATASIALTALLGSTELTPASASARVDTP